MRCGDGGVAFDTSPRWTQFELRHHLLGSFVIDAQVQRDPTMTVSRMLSMHCFNLLFERDVFDRLFSLAIDVLALDAQGFSADRLDPGTAHYLDFCCRCMFNVSSPMSRLSSSFSRFSLL